MATANRQIQEFPLTFEGGLVTEVEDSTLEVGQAASLVNWVPAAQGGLRARNRWGAISTDGLPTDYKVRGWGTIAAEPNPRVVQTFSWPDLDNSDTAGVTTKELTLSDITAGNLLVAIVHSDASISADLVESGWSEITADGDETVRAWFKVADGTETSVTVTQTAGGSTQTIRPNDTINNVGLGTDPHLDISDEDDGTSVSCGSSESGSGHFDAASDPGVNTNHFFKLRVSGNSGTGATHANLWQGDPLSGGTQILDVIVDESSPVHEQSVALSEAEAAMITDYSDLWWELTGGGGTGNRATHEMWMEMPASGADNIIAFEFYELGGVTSTALTDTDVSDSTISLTKTPGQTGGVAILAYSAAADGGVTPTAKTTPSGFTRYNVSVNAGDFRAYSFAKVYTVGTAVADTWAYGGTGVTAGGMELLFDLELNGQVAFYLILAIATDTGYSLYRILRDDIATGTWELLDSDTASDTSAFVSMSQGAGELVWSAIGLDQPRQVTLATLATADVSDLTSVEGAGRAVCYHKDRMFVGGSSANPSRLYFSDIGDPDGFTTATDFLDIGGDDGEAIQDLVSVEGLLLVCKTNRLYLISGSGIESFFVNELSGGSAAAGRAAVRTPYGTLVAGDFDIWVVQGGGVDPMSRPLGADYEITGLVSTAYAQDSVLVADSGTGQVWKANLVTGSWALEEVNDDENVVGHLFSLQGRLYYGVIDSDTEVGGTRRLSSARSFDFVGGTSFEASTGKLALLGPSVTYTPIHLYVQVRNHDADLPNALHVRIISDVGTEEKAFMVDEEVKRYRVDLGKYRNASWIQVAYSADSSAIAGALDIERSVLATYVDAIR